MDIDKNFRKVATARQEFKERAQKENYENSKLKLSSSVETKFKTTFIGALNAFEDEFGDLWGYRRPEREITDEEFHYRKLWEKVRNRILNNGNTQSRNALVELSDYLVEFQGKGREQS